MRVKTGLPPPMSPKKKVMLGRPKGKRKKHPSKNETVNPPPNEVKSKGEKYGHSGFESASSALKRMRINATASGDGLKDADPANAYHANADPANADLANADPANADPANAYHANADPANSDPEEMEHGEMEQPVHMEEPVQEADVQEHVLRRCLRLRRPSQRILLNK
nr:hypothetical protein [Tanacetum cinerariifolium]